MGMKKFFAALAMVPLIVIIAYGWFGNYDRVTHMVVRQLIETLVIGVALYLFGIGLIILLEK